MVAERLRILLQKLKISQREFARKINLDPGYVSRILQGKVTPPLRILLLIENVFHVNKHWLENGKGSMFAPQDISSTKKQVLDLIDCLNDEQVHAVSAFIKYLTEADSDWD